MKTQLLGALLALPLLVTGCRAGRYYDDTYRDMRRLELGDVQRGIFVGMGQDQVAIALGSPNIVTTDICQRETWIYDKIATEVRQSESHGLFLFCQTGAGSVSRADRSQKTLTVVIKFDDNHCVENVAYHSSKF